MLLDETAEEGEAGEVEVSRNFLNGQFAVAQTGLYGLYGGLGDEVVGIGTTGLLDKTRQILWCDVEHPGKLADGTDVPCMLMDEFKETLYQQVALRIVTLIIGCIHLLCMALVDGNQFEYDGRDQGAGYCLIKRLFALSRLLGYQLEIAV